MELKDSSLMKAKELDNYIAELENEVKDLKERNRRLEQANTDIREDNKIRLNQLAMLQWKTKDKRIEILINENSDLRKENRALREENIRLDMIKRDNEVSLEHILEVEEENDKLNKSLGVYRNRVRNLVDTVRTQKIKLDVDKEEIIRLREENRKLKSELDKFSNSFKKYRDYEKEELAESCYDYARENDSLKKELQRYKELLDINENINEKDISN